MNFEELWDLIEDLDPGKTVSILDEVDVKFHCIRSAYGNFYKNKDYSFSDFSKPEYRNLGVDQLMKILYDAVMKAPRYYLFIDGYGVIDDIED